MASFYRKWRPETFSDLVGQEHIKSTLKNALKTRRVGHAYLFAGPRGTGKTTTARLLAKSLNCSTLDYKHDKKGKNLGEPCNQCTSCREIASGQSLDVIEIDAASNRGIEEIRELREKIKFAPASSPFKVFIIDEVHMLTREAFNAILKTLEEPPAHAIFILATTEAHKVLPTIVSRCQRFDFHRGQLSEVKQKIGQVIHDENLKIEDEAIELLANMADGSYRDALSLLEQVASVSNIAEITVGDVRSVLGLARSESVKDFLRRLVSGDVSGLVDLLKTIQDEGGDLAYFANQLIEDLRKLILLKSGVQKELVASDWTQDELGEWAKVSMQFTASEMLALLNSLVGSIPDIKKAFLPQLPLELLAIDWMQRFSKIDQGNKEVTLVMNEPIKVQDLVRVESDTPSGGLAANVDSVSGSDEKKGESPSVIENDRRAWEAIVEKMKPINQTLHTFLKDATAKSFESDKVVIAVRFRFHSERMHDRKNKQMIEKVILEVCGKPLRLECLIDDKLPKPLPVMEQEIMSTAVEVFGMEE
ncbi:MAG: DNA polymerase III subunit gamma/tau [bacterium]|nr:DNA polymerase III subunit gamma/tau [bacterium]